MPELAIVLVAGAIASVGSTAWAVIKKLWQYRTGRISDAERRALEEKTAHQARHHIA